MRARNFLFKFLLLAAICFPTGLLFGHSANAYQDDESSYGRGDRHRRGVPGIGVNLDVGKILSGNKKKEEDPFAEPPTPTTPDGEGTDDGNGLEVDDGPGAGENIDENEPKCHCQGGRLLVIIGNFEDETVTATREWSVRLATGPLAKSHLHILSYQASGKSEPDWTNYYVPDASSKTGWKKMENVRKDEDKDKTLAQDCCYFDEVMIVFHGGQAGAWGGVMKHMPNILNYKPAKKVTLWSCKSSQLFFPNRKGLVTDYYEKVCGVFRPKDCPCGCEEKKCNAFDADGKLCKCPTKDKPVIVYAAGAFKKKATDLGYDTKNPNNPLCSPDGTLRQITIAPDGTITAKMTEPGAQVFGPATVNAKDYPQGEGEKFDEKKHMADSKVIEPKYKKDYSGPKTCEDKEGCFPGKKPAKT